MSKTKKITVENTEISVILHHGTDDFICLTDMARYKDNDPAFVIGHWLRLRNTIEYMGHEKPCIIQILNPPISVGF